MNNSLQFSKRATADQVLAGVDLSGKCIVVTGCSGGLGLETLNAFAANGAKVIGLARTIEAATRACSNASRLCFPVACDLADLASVAAAAVAIRRTGAPLDAIVASAGTDPLVSLSTRQGVEVQFMINHIGHFALVKALADLLRDETGRIVIVSGDSSIRRAPPQGRLFDNLDGRLFYEPSIFFGQSKFVDALYAKELSRRLSGRGIVANAADPGRCRTGAIRGFARFFAKSAARGAATQAWLAASPQAAGISGSFWQDCRIGPANPLIEDAILARRLWEVSEDIAARWATRPYPSLQRAA